MPSLGPLEILVIFIVALLVFGPNKLPELARQVGKGLAEFRRVQQHLRSELDDAIHSVMDDDQPKGAAPSIPPVVTEPAPPPPELERGPAGPAEPPPAVESEPTPPPRAEDAS